MPYSIGIASNDLNQFGTKHMERKTGLEPATYSLGSCHSTGWATSAYFQPKLGINLMQNRFTTRNQWFKGTIETIRKLGRPS